jgi:hypothetical protein
VNGPFFADVTALPEHFPRHSANPAQAGACVPPNAAEGAEPTWPALIQFSLAMHETGRPGRQMQLLLEREKT